MKKKKKKDNRGGKRKGAGRKSEYGEPTKVMSFRYPASKLKEFEAMIYTKLASLKK